MREALKSSARLLDTGHIGRTSRASASSTSGRRVEPVKTNLKTDTSRRRVPVNTVLSGFLATPGHRPGHLRPRGRDRGPELHADVHLHPDHGRGRRRQLQPRWFGNDGTFSAPATIGSWGGRADAARGHDQPDRERDPLGGASPGRFASRLGIEYETSNRRDRSGPVHRGKQLLGDEVGHDRPEPDAEATSSASPPAPRPSRWTSAARRQLPVRGRPASCASIRGASGSTSNASTSCYAPPAGGSCEATRTAARPRTREAGVWEITVEGRRTSDTAGHPVHADGVDPRRAVSPNPDTIAVGTDRRSDARSYSLPNMFGTFTGQAVGNRSAAPGPAHSRSRTSRSSSTRPTSRRARRRSARRSADRPTRPRTSISSSTIAPLRHDSHAQGPERRRRLRGVGHDRQPGCGHLAGPDRRLHVPAGTTTYNYVDIFANPGRLGLGDRRQRAASRAARRGRLSAP